MKLNILNKKNTATTNAKLGSDLEKRVCEILKDYGFFAHNCLNGVVGQPCDIIAMHGNINILLDCKHLNKGTRFDFKNIQDNQYACFEKAEKFCEIKRTGFVIYCEDLQKLYYLPFSLVKANQNYSSISVHCEQLELFSAVLNYWREEYENNYR